MFKKGQPGRIWTDEQRKAASVRLTGSKLSESTRKKLSAWHTGRKLSAETKIKMSIAHKKIINTWTKKITGERHHNWIKDRAKLIKKQERRDSLYCRWRKEVVTRDGGICKIKNRDCAGKIVVHHILGWASFPELRYDINNGITLCQAHHPLKRAEEKRLVPIFKELVSVSKKINWESK